MRSRLHWQLVEWIEVNAQGCDQGRGLAAAPVDVGVRKAALGCPYSGRARPAGLALGAVEHSGGQRGWAWHSTSRQQCPEQKANVILALSGTTSGAVAHSGGQSGCAWHGSLVSVSQQLTMDCVAQHSGLCSSTAEN